MMTSLDKLPSGKRIVVKIGSSLLVDSVDGVRKDWLASFVEDVAGYNRDGGQVIIVSSGAIALGRTRLRLSNRSLHLDESQATAAVGQIELSQIYNQMLAQNGFVAAQILLTLRDTEGRTSRRSYLNARATLERLLMLKSVPIVNENDTVATSEIRYGDNDRLAARVATMVGADYLILLSDIDGLYSAPPAQNPDAEFIPIVNEITYKIEAMAGTAGSELSRGGMITKIEAAKIATEAGTAMVIMSGDQDKPISILASGGKATWFRPSASKSSGRKKWIAGQLQVKGSLYVDDGAVEALAKGSSLLPAGVVRIEGRFEGGDAVAIKDKDNRILGRGLVTYDHTTAEKVMGHRSTEIVGILGYSARTIMVHRDDMVLSGFPDETLNLKKA